MEKKLPGSSILKIVGIIIIIVSVIAIGLSALGIASLAIVSGIEFDGIEELTTVIYLSVGLGIAASAINLISGIVAVKNNTQANKYPNIITWATISIVFGLIISIALPLYANSIVSVFAGTTLNDFVALGELNITNMITSSILPALLIIGALQNKKTL